MAGVISKPKAARQKRNKAYYERMYFRVADRKQARINKAKNCKAYWLKRGVKRNGKPVKGATQGASQ